jgi:23S rRNA (cytosine1962-C5)-methyltransferase
MQEMIAGAARPVRLLNLFGYTGIASLVAARAGAQVTHVDASRKAVAWARENQEMSGLSGKPIRWIIDDAVKFCEREMRRESRYDAIVLDPPKFGRGPKGEIWQLFEGLPHLLDVVRALVTDRPLFVILTAYSIRASFFAMHEICQEVFGDMGGRLESGELVILSQNSERRLSTSLFTRWIAP